MKLLILLLPLISTAKEMAMPFCDEETLNWRLNSSQDKIDYSSRLRLIKIDNFSSGMIIRYKFDLTPNTKLSEIDDNSPDSLFYINYKF